MPDHAAARLLQCAPQVDPRAAYEAGLAFLAGDASVAAPLIGRETSIYLPTSGLGAFLCNVIGGQTRDQQRRYIFAGAGT
jgi:hypothetical protein